MGDSSKSVNSRKPVKPRPDFPLFPHNTGRSAKNVKGKLRYFGPTRGDEKGQKALTEWLRVKDDLLAGRKPRPKATGVTVADICNRFLTRKKRMKEDGEIKLRTFFEYHCEQMVKVCGGDRAVTDLTPDDFSKLRQSLAQVRGAVGLGNEINRCRMVFKFAIDEGLLDRPMLYGQSFQRPSRKTLRLERMAKGRGCSMPRNCEPCFRRPPPQ